MSEIKINGTTFDQIWEALRGIGNYPNLPFNMRMASNIQLLQTQAKRRQRLMYDITEKYVLKEEKGGWKIENNAPVYENQSEVNKVFEAENEKDFTITVKEIDFKLYPEQFWNSLPANLLAPLLGTVIVNYDESALKLSM